MAPTENEILSPPAPPRADDKTSDAAAESAVVEADERERAAPAIEFRNVHFSFDDKKVLDDISFTVTKGESTNI